MKKLIILGLILGLLIGLMSTAEAKTTSTRGSSQSVSVKRVVRKSKDDPMPTGWKVNDSIPNGWEPMPDGWEPMPDGWEPVPDGWEPVPDGLVYGLEEIL